MNWNHFMLLLAGAYALWYAGNILWDTLRQPRSSSTGDNMEELLFEGDIEPQLITYEEQPPQTQAAPVATQVVPQEVLPATGRTDGLAMGLSLKELVRAAQENLIEFTGTIPY